MITKEKFAANLLFLKGILPTKPLEYTSTYPKTIKEALKYYCNRRTVHTIQACTINLNNENWPLPLWYNPNNVKVGFWNLLYYKTKSRGKNLSKKIKDYNFFSVLVMNRILLKLSYDETIIEAFNANSKYAFKNLLINPILKSKKYLIESLINSYKTKNWIACIITIFTLIDYVARSVLKTRNLSIDISKICSLFKQNGFSLETADHLMPYFTFVLSYKEDGPFMTTEREQWLNKMLKTDFGIIGAALSSFIRFANIYYAYYKEDEEEVNVLNRHAIMHGSIASFGSKVHAIKLFTFLYLFLELEPVFNILLNEKYLDNVPH